MRWVAAVVEELTLSAPLVVPAAGGVQVQVVVGAADESGSRAVSVYSRGVESDSEWMLHAEGVLRVRRGRGRQRICRCGRPRARSAVDVDRRV